MLNSDNHRFIDCQRATKDVHDLSLHNSFGAHDVDVERLFIHEFYGARGRVSCFFHISPDMIMGEAFKELSRYQCGGVSVLSLLYLSKILRTN